MIALINRLGCEYVGHKYNYSYWGGTLLFSFKKNKFKQNINNPKFDINNAMKVKSKFTNFKYKLSKDLEVIIDTKEPVFGFGAAQMHLQS